MLTMLYTYVRTYICTVRADISYLCYTHYIGMFLPLQLFEGLLEQLQETALKTVDRNVRVFICTYTYV